VREGILLSGVLRLTGILRMGEYCARYEGHHPRRERRLEQLTTIRFDHGIS
jgi:hypothetical protein